MTQNNFTGCDEHHTDCVRLLMSRAEIAAVDSWGIEEGLCGRGEAARRLIALGVHQAKMMRLFVALSSRIAAISSPEASARILSDDLFGRLKSIAENLEVLEIDSSLYDETAIISEYILNRGKKYHRLDDIGLRQENMQALRGFIGRNAELTEDDAQRLISEATKQHERGKARKRKSPASGS